MDVIPVIDIKEGQVVLARRGFRSQYRPLSTPLCPSSDPIAVVRSMLNYRDFSTFYVADLDGLMGNGSQAEWIEQLSETFPEKIFWVDGGFRDLSTRFHNKERSIIKVIGSESLVDSDLGLLSDLPKDFILSLDFMQGKLLGPDALLQQSNLWPNQVILMDLSYIGAGLGPNLARLGRFIKAYPEHNFISAGGVRDDHDLLSLDALGASAALVASALHAFRFSPEIFSAVERGRMADLGAKKNVAP